MHISDQPSCCCVPKTCFFFSKITTITTAASCNHSRKSPTATFTATRPKPQDTHNQKNHNFFEKNTKKSKKNQFFSQRRAQKTCQGHDQMRFTTQAQNQTHIQKTWPELVTIHKKATKIGRNPATFFRLKSSPELTLIAHHRVKIFKFPVIIFKNIELQNTACPGIPTRTYLGFLSGRFWDSYQDICEIPTRTHLRSLPGRIWDSYQDVFGIPTRTYVGVIVLGRANMTLFSIEGETIFEHI